jgi:4-hydroxy-2-oxoheptanedioate aldolase
LTTPELRLRERLRQHLKSPRLTVGTFLKLPGTVAVEIAGLTGLDLVVVDDEHSGLDRGEVVRIVRHAVRCDLPVLVRIGDIDPTWIGTLLDVGATGIQLAGLEHPDQVARLAEATVPPPAGNRGTSLSVPAARFGLIELEAHLTAERRQPPVLIGQVESAQAVERVDQLLPGLDAVFVGTTDLAARHGTNRASDLERQVVAAARRAAIPTGRFEGLASDFPDEHRDFVLVASDVATVTAGLKAIADRWRAIP